MEGALGELDLAGVLAAQRVPGWSVPLWIVLSMLGSELFYLVLLPIVAWAWHPGLGYRAAALLLISNAINATLKLALQLPRPFWVDERVVAHSGEGSFGMPSGHAMNSAALLGLFAVASRSRLVQAALGTLVVSIAISRVVLGVHFPSDVGVGLVLGLLLLATWVRLERPVIARLEAATWAGKLGAAALVAAVVIAIPVALLVAFPEPASLSAWAERSGAFEESGPRTLASAASTAGSIFGLGVGLTFATHTGALERLDPSGEPVIVRALRVLVGLAAVFALYLGLRAVLPHGESAIALGGRFVRYALVLTCVAAGVPWVSVRLSRGSP